jgi:hypothetical protein
MDGLRAGLVAIHEGESRLFLDGYDAAGLRAEDASTRTLRLRGHLDDARASSGLLLLTRVTTCDDPRPALDPPTVDEEAIYEATITPGASFDVSVEVTGEPGVFFALLLRGPPSFHYSALSRAVVIRAPEAPPSP